MKLLNRSMELLTVCAGDRALSDPSILAAIASVGVEVARLAVSAPLKEEAMPLAYSLMFALLDTHWKSRALSDADRAAMVLELTVGLERNSEPSVCSRLLTCVATLNEHHGLFRSAAFSPCASGYIASILNVILDGSQSSLFDDLVDLLHGAVSSLGSASFASFLSQFLSQRRGFPEDQATALSMNLFHNGNEALDLPTFEANVSKLAYEDQVIRSKRTAFARLA